MGLLSFDTPEQQFGLGILMNNNAGKEVPGFMQLMAAGAQQQQNWQKQKSLDEIMQMRKAEMLAQQQAQQSRMEALKNFRSQLPEEMRGMFDVDPEGFIKSLRKEPKEPQLVTVDTPNGPVQRWVRPGEANGVDIGAPVQKEAAAPWYVKKLPDGRTMIDPAFADLEKTKAAFGRPPAQPMQPVAYVDPASGQTVWGTITEARGKPAANYNPLVQGAVAGAKTAASETAKNEVEGISNLPKAIASGEEALKQVAELRTHPGFGTAVGASSLLGIQHIPGTDAKDFMNRLKQLKGGAFLTAFETLKGSGQITEIEGQKATEALARMDNATSEKEFISALDDYAGIIRKSVNNAKLRAGKRAVTSSGQESSGAVGGVKFLGFE